MENNYYAQSSEKDSRSDNVVDAFWHIFRREIHRFSKRPIFLMIMFVAPLTFLWLFTSMMGSGLPTKLPAAIVDEDNTHITRQLTRILGSMEETHFVLQTNSFTEARQAMQRGEIYGIFRIPKGTTVEALTQRQPVVSFYTNDTYYIAASLMMKDMRKLGEMAGIAMTRATLQAKGVNENKITATIQPILVEAHPLGNPHLNYSVVLTNLLVPGIIMLLAMLTTSYALGIEWKRGRQKQLLNMAGGRAWLAVLAKLVPQTMLYTLLFWVVDLVLYSYLQFPCHCGIPRMMLWGFLAVTASQGFGLLLFEAFPGMMRMSMSACSLLGVMEFSLAGFSFPVTAMDRPFQWLANLFPLHHYFYIYVNQALNGYDIGYVWYSVAHLLFFTIVPLLFMYRLKNAFLYKEYKA